MDKQLSVQGTYRYLPALDGFRAISILLVLISHAGLENVVPGGLGVMVFFVISGFLITRQMMSEIEQHGALSLSRFYLRRLFRLAPTLLLYIAVFVPLLNHLGADITAAQVLSGIFYFANYYQMIFGYDYHNPIPITWSLSVEEHYYILFPFVMLLFRRNLVTLVPWLMVILVFVLLWRLHLASLCHAYPAPAICGLPGSERIFHGTDTIFDCILYGALTALMLQYHTLLTQRLFINRTAFPLAVLALGFTLLYRNPLWRETARFSVQSASIAVIMINVLFDQRHLRLRGLLSRPLLLMIGRLSYSLYLFHYGVLCTIEMIHSSTLTMYTLEGLIVYFGASFLLAALSYHFVEKPMIALRKQFGSHQPATL